MQLHRHHGVVGLAGSVGGVVMELAHDLHGLHKGVQSCKRREELLVGEDGSSFLFALTVTKVGPDRRQQQSLPKKKASSSSDGLPSCSDTCQVTDEAECT